MAAVTIHSDFRAQEEEICYYFHFFPFCLPWSNGARCHDLSFFIFSFKPAVSLSSFTLKRLFSSSLLSAVRVVSSAFLRLLKFLEPVLIPAYNTSRLAFLLMCSGYRLNKQGDGRQPCRTPFSIQNLSVVLYRVLTVASQPIHVSQETGKMVWYSHHLKSFPQFVMMHTLKGFSVVNETEVDIFLEFLCFLYDPRNVGNLIWFLCLF